VAQGLGDIQATWTRLLNPGSRQQSADA